MSGDEDDGGSGYGRPPKKDQFKPGQSGNPRGRPKGSKSFKTVVTEALKQHVVVRTDGQRQQMPLPRAIVLRVLHSAAAGDKTATKQALQLMERFISDEVPDETSADLSVLSDEDFWHYGRLAAILLGKDEEWREQQTAQEAEYRERWLAPGSIGPRYSE